MKIIIQLKIEKLREKEEEYFVATSDDLEGLVAEGKTIEEVIEIAQDVAQILLELDKKINNNNLRIRDIPNIFEYPLIMDV
jgi:predicted RNase H-like HicB family nuclease